MGRPDTNGPAFGPRRGRKEQTTDAPLKTRLPGRSQSVHSSEETANHGGVKERREVEAE